MQLIQAALWHDQLIAGTVSASTRQRYLYKRKAATGGYSGSLAYLLSYFGEAFPTASFEQNAFRLCHRWLMHANLNARSNGRLAPYSANRYWSDVCAFCSRLTQHGYAYERPERRYRHARQPVPIRMSNLEPIVNRHLDTGDVCSLLAVVVLETGVNSYALSLFSTDAFNPEQGTLSLPNKTFFISSRIATASLSHWCAARINQTSLFGLTPYQIDIALSDIGRSIGHKAAYFPDALRSTTIQHFLRKGTSVQAVRLLVNPTEESRKHANTLRHIHKNAAILDQFNLLAR